MIIIADSGSSKTDWRLISGDGVIKEVNTSGLNPQILSGTDFVRVIRDSDLIQWPLEDIEKIYFYGAGITNKQIKVDLIRWLKSIFSNAEIEAYSDLLAAARALYGNNSGLVGILGTGSNIGYYNGSELEKSIPILGYLLGDEGSGNALGKRLTVAFLRNELSPTLNNEFMSFYPDYNNLLSNIYKNEQPARLLASFVPFIHQHLESKIIGKMVEEEFTKYFRLFKKLENISGIALIGSLAYYFKPVLEDIALAEGLKLTKVMKSPIEALTLHHQQELT